MTSVKFRQENGVLSMEVRGHTGFAELGRDPVCAGVSTMAMTVAQCAQDMGQAGKLQKAAHVVVRSGRVLATVKPKEEYLPEALHLYQVGLTGMQLLAEVYPESVVLEVFDAGKPESIDTESSTIRTD